MPAEYTEFSPVKPSGVRYCVSMFGFVRFFALNDKRSPFTIS